jgi:hypothetical protein
MRTLLAVALLATLAVLVRAAGKAGISNGLLYLWGLWVGEIVIVECRRALGHARPTIRDVMVGAVLSAMPVLTAYTGAWLVGAAGFGFALAGLWWYLRYVETAASVRLTGKYVN